MAVPLFGAFAAPNKDTSILSVFIGWSCLMLVDMFLTLFNCKYRPSFMCPHLLSTVRGCLLGDHRCTLLKEEEYSI